jgi:hypothetical protein
MSTTRLQFFALVHIDIKLSVRWVGGNRNSESCIRDLFANGDEVVLAEFKHKRIRNTPVILS